VIVATALDGAVPDSDELAPAYEARDELNGLGARAITFRLDGESVNDLVPPIPAVAFMRSHVVSASRARQAAKRRSHS
jgi:hypothetical protein